MANQNSDTQNKSPLSFGPKLKQARVSQGLSIDDVAGKLFILRRHLEAIEAEDFKELPQIAFARGFVVNYSKLLGLDPEQMVDAFNNSYPEELKKKSVSDIESPLKPMGTLQRDGGRSWRINPLLVIGVIGLIILAIFLLRTISNARDNTQPDVASTDLVNDLSDSEQVAGASLNTTTNSNVANTGSALGIDNAGSAVGVANNAQGSTNNSKLNFWVKGETVINVTDATGASLMNGEKPRGGYNVEGMPPFKIQIDDVSKVTLDADNQPINLNDFAENNKADFTLPSQ